MGKRLNILVLGVGGNVSQGILKALAVSKLDCRVVGACISSLALGLYTVDRGYVSPRADDPIFVDWLMDVCKKENIDAVFSGVEEVLWELSNNATRIREETGALCIVDVPSKLSIGNDKLLTCKWLQDNQLNYPKYAPSEDENAIDKLVNMVGFPLIAKPRKGKGSRGIVVINNSAELRSIRAINNYVVQEYIGNDDAEYTAGCFCDTDGNVRGTIILRRELLEGTTYRAELGDYPLIRDEVIRISRKLRPMGTCNLQLRVAADRPVCFEINSRFSGTTPIRARLGFNEVEAVLRNYVLKEPGYDLPLISKGVVLRYWNEMYIDSDAVNTLRQTGVLEEPAQFNLEIEDYGFRGEKK